MSTALVLLCVVKLLIIRLYLQGDSILSKIGEENGEGMSLLRVSVQQQRAQTMTHLESQLAASLVLQSPNEVSFHDSLV